MSEREWVKWYPADFLASTIGLTAAEVGGYTLMLIEVLSNGTVWQEGDRRLMRLLKMRSKSLDRLISTLVAHRLVEVEDGILHFPMADRWASFDGRRRLPDAIREQVYQMFKGACVYCGSTTGDKFHVDHIYPVSRGGSDDIENLALACPTCNLSKGSKTLEEWLP